jgi:hypothetical protein
MPENSLIGTWRLVSYEQRGSDDRVSFPLGRQPLGYLVYAADGYMSVQMMARQRPGLPGGDVGAGSTEDKAAALDTYRAYCGPYEIAGDRVIHHVQISSWPNRAGTDLVRLMTFVEGRLHLRTAPFNAGGVTQTAELVWVRAR